MYKLYPLVLIALLSACGGGGGGGDSSSSSNSSNTTVSQQNAPKVIFSDVSACTPSGATVTISGTVSYQRVPFSATSGGGLDYSNIQTLPIRGADIQALGASDCVMASGQTSSTGTYSLTVSQNTAVKIRIKASSKSSSGAIWDVELRDNTNGSGLYVLDGSFTNSGSANSVRNLTATSGWGGSSYTGDRNSAPFAILDTIYDGIQLLVGANASVNIAAADVFWSVNNSTASGSLSNGEIGSSFFFNNQIYILGAENSDTDEFDQHIVAHEWGHHVADNVFRDDSIGGSHSLNQRLDMRVAASEGFGNAFSAMVTGDPVYRDAFGSQQGFDFSFNMETNTSINRGWYNEASVHTVLYDIFDSAVDASDGVNLGFTPIYNAMSSAAFTGQSSLTSIYSIAQQIKTDNAGSAAAIDTILNAQDMVVNDFFGTGETNNGGDANNLPVYKSLMDDGVPVVVCSTDDQGTYNKLGNRQFIRLQINSTGSHNVVATRVSGLTSSNPDIRVYRNGSLVALGSSSNNNTETATGNLTVSGADAYVIEVFHRGNTTSGTSGDVCFNVSVS